MIHRLRHLFSRNRDRDAELREELEFHIHARAEHNRETGVPDPESAARRRFGNATIIQEDTRSQRGFPLLESIAQDARYALRGFRRNTAFTVTAVCALTLGIGATTAVFSVVDRILFRPLPYPSSDRLVSVGMFTPLDPAEFLLAPDYIDWRRDHSVFESMSSWFVGGGECDLTEQPAARLRCRGVGATMLGTLGVAPILGRMFTADEDRPNAPRVALISHALWRTRFAADPHILDRTISLDAEPVRIIGVLPAAFECPPGDRPDILRPQALDPAPSRSGPYILVRGIARLKPGVSLAQARTAMTPLFQASLVHVPAQFRNEVRLAIRSMHDWQTGGSQKAGWLLFGAVLAVLLIACANVANLLLARAAARRRELGMRLALGAGRARLYRQALVESLILALTGAIAGIALAAILLRAFVAIAPDGIAFLAGASLDGRVLAFTLAVSAAAAFAFGVLPAWESPRAALGAWKQLGQTREHFRRVLVGVQIAVSLVLVCAAAMLVESLWNMQRVPLGMQPESVLTAQIALGSHVPPQRRAAFFEQLEAKAAAIPGVETAAVTDSIPLTGSAQAMIYSLIQPEGRAPQAQGTGGMVTHRTVTPGYFSALRIPILRGRAFQDSDRLPGHDVMILGDSLARRLFPGEDPLGRRIQAGRTGPWRTVVGIAANVKNASLATEDAPEYYQPRKVFAAAPTPGAETARRNALLVRTALDPESMARAIRQQVESLDPTLPVAVVPFRQQLARHTEAPRFEAWLLGMFAAAGVLLAAIGLYGVLSFLIARQTQEIGVRMALGATPPLIARLVLRRALRWTLGGAILGIAASFAAQRWLASLLFGVASPAVPAALASALLFAVALIAAWIPARRAARIDPLAALRQE
ncbi:MAG: ABC transporter permease [Bryobacteraceae bacterium]